MSNLYRELMEDDFVTAKLKKRISKSNLPDLFDDDAVPQ